MCGSNRATGGACGFAYAIASNALKGAIWGAVQGAIGGLVNGAVEYYEENGTLDGSGQHLLESTAQGFVEGTFSGTIDGVGSGALQFAKSPNSFCFIGGTFVLTSKGYKVIEEIRIGDKVLSTDPETGDTTEKTVLQTFERQTTEFVDVTIGGETYTTTPEHPFYVEGKDFVNASELEVGDKVVCYDTETDTTETKEVEEVHNYETDEPLTVYNFEVHEYHTYHVGEDGVLVHNGCKKAGGSSGPGNGNGHDVGQTSSVHGNSRTSTKPQHGYEIYDTDTGDVVKTGISGQQLNLNGTSPRANSQVNRLNRMYGEEKYSARVVINNMPNRAVALEWEKNNALSLWNAGNSMSIHQRPAPWR